VSPFFLLTGASSSTVTSGWLFAQLGWCGLLLTRYLVSPFTMVLYGVKVYVMGVCRRHVWAVEVVEGEGERQEGETALTNTKIIKQNIKAWEAQNHKKHARTTPSHLSSLVEHNLLHL